MSREFNFQFDPEATHIVLRRYREIEVVAYDACQKYSVWAKDAADQIVDNLLSTEEHSKQSVRFLKEITRLKLSRPAAFPGRLMICDLLAAAVAKDSTLVSKAVKVDLEIDLEGEHTRGQLICHSSESAYVEYIPRPSYPHSLVVDIDKQRYDQMIDALLS
jgi:inosine-uridine nucleoside N-ribohydrolase